MKRLLPLALALFILTGSSDGPGLQAQQTSDSIGAAIGKLQFLLDETRELIKAGKKEEASAMLEQYYAEKEALIERLPKAPVDIDELVTWASTTSYDEALQVIRNDLAAQDFSTATGRIRVYAWQHSLDASQIQQFQCLLGKAFDTPKNKILPQFGGDVCEAGTFLWEYLEMETGKADSPHTVAEPGPVSVTGVETRVTESLGSWSQWSWKATVRNQTGGRQSFDLEVQWLDSDGFIVETDTLFDVALDPNEERVVRGSTLIEADASGRVDQIVGHIE